MAWWGHRGGSFLASVSVTPSLNGSVLDALMYISTTESVTITSLRQSVDHLSYLVLWDDVYSDTLRKPKKAVSSAAHSINFSTGDFGELIIEFRIRSRQEGVIGALRGLFLDLPCVLFIPLIT